MESEVGVLLEPVLLWAPPTREIVEMSGVEKVKLFEVAVPAESADMTA